MLFWPMEKSISEKQEAVENVYRQCKYTYSVILSLTWRTFLCLLSTFERSSSKRANYAQTLYGWFRVCRVYMCLTRCSWRDCSVPNKILKSRPAARRPNRLGTQQQTPTSTRYFNSILFIRHPNCPFALNRTIFVLAPAPPAARYPSCRLAFLLFPLSCAPRIHFTSPSPKHFVFQSSQFSLFGPVSTGTRLLWAWVWICMCLYCNVPEFFI